MTNNNIQALATQTTGEIYDQLWNWVNNNDLRLVDAHGVYFNAVLGIYNILEEETGIDLTDAIELVEQNVEVTDEFISRKNANKLFFAMAEDATKQVDDQLTFIALLAGKLSKLVTKEMVQMMQEGVATAMPLNDMAYNMMNGHKAFEAALAAA